VAQRASVIVSALGNLRVLRSETGVIQCVRKVAVHLWKLLEVKSTSVDTDHDFDGLRSIESEMSINFLSLSLDGLHFVRRLKLSLLHEISQ
jgi:hypothetical protein